jgi:hypothetical protein
VVWCAVRWYVDASVVLAVFCSSFHPWLLVHILSAYHCAHESFYHVLVLMGKVGRDTDSEVELRRCEMIGENGWCPCCDFGFVFSLFIVLGMAMFLMFT